MSDVEIEIDCLVENDKNKKRYNKTITIDTIIE
jgi:hypothetical protein